MSVMTGSMNEMKELMNELKQIKQMFRANHTTVHWLINLTNEISMNGKMLALDLKKAFNLVWQDGLVYKLYKNKLPTGLG